jgi:hypothetical protein
LIGIGEPAHDALRDRRRRSMTRIQATVTIACAIAAGVPGGAASAADPTDNRKASANYEAVVRGSPGFRANREHVECDGIESLDLKAQCIASFDAPTPIRPTAPTDAPIAADPAAPRVTITNGPVRNPDDE